MRRDRLGRQLPQGYTPDQWPGRLRTRASGRSLCGVVSLHPLLFKLRRRMRLPHLVFPLLATGSLQAQWQPRYPSPALRPNIVRTLPRPAFPAEPRSAGRLVLGSLVGSVVGLGAGLLTYSVFDRQQPCFASDCDSDLGAGLLPATAGMTIATPLGAHLANGRRGSYSKGLLLSAAAAAVVWGGAALADDARWLLLLPPAQIAVSVLAERRTTR